LDQSPERIRRFRTLAYQVLDGTHGMHLPRLVSDINATLPDEDEGFTILEATQMLLTAPTDADGNEQGREFVMILGNQ